MDYTFCYVLLRAHNSERTRFSRIPRESARVSRFSSLLRPDGFSPPLHGVTRTKSHGRTYREDRRPIVRVSILRSAFPVRVSPPRASAVAYGKEARGKS